MDVKNFSIAGYDIVDELYTDFGTDESALEGWPAFRVAGFAIYEDETPHAGSPLQLGVDYELGGKDTRKSYELGEDIYTTLTMLTHDTGDIYITYNSIGSYVDADEVQELRSNYDTLLGLYDTAVQGLIPLRLDEQDISAAAKETDLTIYEPGGASAKLSGWRVTVRWTGGNGTYQHTFDTAYTVGGLAASSWAGKGTGQLTLQLDLDNENWIPVETAAEWDRSGIAVSAVSTLETIRYTNRKMKVVQSATVTSTGNALVVLYLSNVRVPAVAFPVAFGAVPIITGWSFQAPSNAVGLVIFGADGNPMQTATHTGYCGGAKVGNTTGVEYITVTYEGTEA
jgi:hypothetical protein